MSNVTFDFFSIKTVPPDYSWDDGTPYVEFPYERLITDASLLSGTDSTYIGYAPFAYISLSSSVVPSPSSVAIQRVVDFGDYYNTESNITTSPTLSNEVYCHTYIMPGLYTIKFTKHEYVITLVEEYSDLYIQPQQQAMQQLPFNWQWYNFLCSSPTNPRNNPITWEQSGFQDSNQLIWSGVSGPCLDFNSYNTASVDWLWNSISCDLNANPLARTLTWDETKSSSTFNKTWDEAGGDNCNQPSLALSAQEVVTITKEMMLRVIEIPPVAYLSAMDITPEKLSPLTVRLTPRFVKTGSFPIEKIVWDLGDGSPLLTQRRWSPDSVSPFVFSNVFNLDWQDPRNFDIIYTYRKLPDSGFSYYPSITAYSSSTGTSDCASTIVGPLKLTAFDGATITLLQNELTDNGKVIVGETNDGVAVWKIDN